MGYIQYTSSLKKTLQHLQRATGSIFGFLTSALLDLCLSGVVDVWIS